MSEVGVSGSPRGRRVKSNSSSNLRSLIVSGGSSIPPILASASTGSATLNRSTDGTSSPKPGRLQVTKERAHSVKDMRMKFEELIRGYEAEKTASTHVTHLSLISPRGSKLSNEQSHAEPPAPGSRMVFFKDIPTDHSSTAAQKQEEPKPKEEKTITFAEAQGNDRSIRGSIRRARSVSASMPTIITSSSSPSPKLDQRKKRSKKEEKKKGKSKGKRKEQEDSEEEDGGVFEMDDDDDLVSPRTKEKKKKQAMLAATAMANSSDSVLTASPRNSPRKPTSPKSRREKDKRSLSFKSSQKLKLDIDESVLSTSLQATPLTLDEALAHLPRSSPRAVVSPRSPAASPRALHDDEITSSDDDSSLGSLGRNDPLGSSSTESSLRSLKASTGSVSSESYSFSSTFSSFSPSPNMHLACISPRSASSGSSDTFLSPRRAEAGRKRVSPVPPLSVPMTPPDRPDPKEVHALIQISSSLKNSADSSTEPPKIPVKPSVSFSGPSLSLDLKRTKEVDSGSLSSQPSPRTLSSLRGMKQRLKLFEKVGVALSPRGSHSPPPLPPKPSVLFSKVEPNFSAPSVMGSDLVVRGDSSPITRTREGHLFRSNSSSDILPGEPLVRQRSASVSSPKGLITPSGFQIEPEISLSFRPGRKNTSLIGGDLIVTRSPRPAAGSKRPSEKSLSMDSSLDSWTSMPLLFDEWVDDDPPTDRVLMVNPLCRNTFFHVEYGRTGVTFPKLDTIEILGSEDDAPFYADVLSKLDHTHYFGEEDPIGPVIVSIEKDKEKSRLRAIVRLKSGDERVVVPASKKDTLKAIYIAIPRLLPVKLTKTKDPDLTQELLKFERQAIMKNFKFGILYCKEGQTEEDDMFCNEHGSPDFDEFLDFLGKKVVLEGWNQFRGGLDVKTNTTGTHSIYTSYRDYEIMFHCSTLLPFTPGDPQQLERKRHLGNDIVIIVFKEGDQQLDPNVFRTQFIHVWFVVSKVIKDGKVMYRLEVANKAGVKPHKPYLPEDPTFERSEDFRQFLLAKLINSERAALAGPEFKTKATRTRTMMLHTLVDSASKKKTSAKTNVGSFFGKGHLSREV